jgi:Hydroxyphenylpyruvate dioxygenase, HPPD, N-terminal
MGPFPHDAPPAAITPENPTGTDGFAFVEFAHPEPLQLHRLFRLMGFAEVAKHRTKAITVYRQGDVDYLVNEEPNHSAQGRRGFWRGQFPSSLCVDRGRSDPPWSSQSPARAVRRVTAYQFHKPLPIFRSNLDALDLAHTGRRILTPIWESSDASGTLASHAPFA